jgi:hypothetical protein
MVLAEAIPPPSLVNSSGCIVSDESGIRKFVPCEDDVEDIVEVDKVGLLWQEEDAFFEEVELPLYGFQTAFDRMAGILAPRDGSAFQYDPSNTNDRLGCEAWGRTGNVLLYKASENICDYLMGRPIVTLL